MQSEERQKKAPLESVTTSTSEQSCLAQGQILERLRIIEEKMAANNAPRQSKYQHVIDAVKLILGGWPAVGLIFMVVFYSPIRKSLDAIPKKIETAEELEVAGVSLKKTIKKEAEKTGLDNLAKILPSLSPDAITQLLKANERNNLLMMYGIDNPRDSISSLTYPSDSVVRSLHELEKSGLIQFKYFDRDKKTSMPTNAESIAKYIKEFKEKYPGTDAAIDLNGSNQRIWKIFSPIENDAANMYHPSWYLTNLGKNASSIITVSVHKTLTDGKEQIDTE